MTFEVVRIVNIKSAILRKVMLGKLVNGYQLFRVNCLHLEGTLCHITQRCSLK
jgi:hypothetical protein